MKSAHRRNIRYAESAQRERLKEEGTEHISYRRVGEEEQSLSRKIFGKPVTREEFERAEEAIGKAVLKGGKAVVGGLKSVIVGKPLTEAEKKRQQELRNAYEEARHNERLLRARMAGRASVKTVREPSLRDLGKGSLQAEKYEAKKRPQTNIRVSTDPVGLDFGVGSDPVGNIFYIRTKNSKKFVKPQNAADVLGLRGYF
jgi:hypothetical protein